MKPRELRNLGIPQGEPIKLAGRLLGEAHRLGIKKNKCREMLRDLVAEPEKYLDDPLFAPLAQAIAVEHAAQATFIERAEPAPWQQWGENLDTNSIEQMANACRLPVAVAGALMPDAHLGYGLPIGGVLATDNAVIPYAVGVDIACRMKLTVLDLPEQMIRSEGERLANAIEQETRFGIGSKFENRREHEVLDENWSVSPITQANKDKAWAQLGTSGSGNHFVEFGSFTIDQADLGLQPGKYLALMSHSGSRGAGAQVAAHYSRLAMDQHPELPKQLKHLAWLDLDSEAGQEYWLAMNLMGEYAEANHAMIHKHIARALKANVIADIENHHNFAWMETHAGINGGRPVIVHRKGATPADKGLLGIIPGSMADPAYVVRGKGVESSLRSAAHGAGRVMSRTKAKSTFTWSSVKKLLKEREVTLLSAGIDEVPGVYKNIDEVMAQQADLVEVVAKFMPRIVKMAPGGEKAED